MGVEPGDFSMSLGVSISGILTMLFMRKVDVSFSALDSISLNDDNKVKSQFEGGTTYADRGQTKLSMGPGNSLTSSCIDSKQDLLFSVTFERWCKSAI